jgi:hypothetical protein
MARGWESKSVEEQIATGPQPVAAVSSNNQQRKQQRDKADLARQIQTLNLQRENILSQRTSNPGRRAALEAALAQIEAQLEALS